MSTTAINYEKGWKRSKEVRREKALQRAEILDRTLFEAIQADEFHAIDVSAITLKFLTEFVNSKGCRSANGKPLAASGVMRHLALLGADWQSYRTQIVERQLSHRPKRLDLEADYRTPSGSADAGQVPVMSETTKSRIKSENTKRSERWSHYISPLTVYEMTAPPGVSFEEWLDERQKVSGNRFRITHEERAALIPQFKQWHYEKYGWASETYVEPEFYIPGRKPKKSN